jgi:catechol 2,3-dioxygenase-like lactoylglutathione lyase family enzyme
VIAGVHTILFADDAEAARAFFRDVLELASVDAGDGWLIFELPPGELACHPGPGWGREIGQQEIFLMCRDVLSTVTELEAKGVEFVTPIEDEGYGLVTRLKVPGAGLLGLYEPRHRSPLADLGGD